MNKVMTCLAVLVISLPLTSLQTVHAASPFETPPIDISTLRTNLSKSMVGVECFGKTGIAFTGNYLITEEAKNQGRRSLLVTNKSLIRPCLETNISRDVKLLKDSNTYSGRIWGWSALNSEDYATISSSLELPVIDLYDTTVPEVGWWVMVASYLPGFGITWTNSAIISVDLKEYFLLLESAPKSLGTGGPVFDNRGRFLGLVTFVQNENPELAKVSGSPNVCDVTGSLSPTGIANCAIGGREKVWVKKAVVTPTPTPTPSSTANSSLTDNSKEAKDAYALALDTYRQYTGQTLSCSQAFKSQSAITNRVLQLVSSSAICLSDENDAKRAYQQVLSLGQSIQTSKEPTSIVKQLGILTSDFKSYIKTLEDAKSLARDLTQIANSFDELEGELVALSEKFDNLDFVLSNLPKKISEQISAVPAFEYLQDYRETTEQLQSEFEDLINEIEQLSKADSNVGETLLLKVRSIQRGLPNSTLVSKTVERAYSSIPSFYCKKGKSVTLAKKGKCQIGYQKVSINKN